MDKHHLSSVGSTQYIMDTRPLSSQVVHIYEKGLTSRCGFLSPFCPCLPASLWLLLHIHVVANTRFKGQQSFLPDCPISGEIHPWSFLFQVTQPLSKI